jgi:hypothetical protein
MREKPQDDELIRGYSELHDKIKETINFAKRTDFLVLLFTIQCFDYRRNDFYLPIDKVFFFRLEYHDRT